MNINRNTPCPCGSGKKYKHCCAQAAPQKKYINEAHEWMDTRVLAGRYPDLYGFLILVDHDIPAAEIWKRLKFYTEEYINFAGNRTQHFHDIIDEEIARQIALDKDEGYNPPFCRKGCANCCCQPVACTDEEARLIYDYCIQNGISINFERLERQLRYMRFDDEGNFTGTPEWDEQPEADRSCVFLENESKSCLIWKVRPFVCRAHLAELTDKHCRSHNGIPDPEAIGIHYPECSYILSAIFTFHHDSVGRMMAALLIDLQRGGGSRFA